MSIVTFGYKVQLKISVCRAILFYFTTF